MYRKPFENHFYGDDPRWFVGVVETPSSADRLGRVRVRVYGLHSNSTADIDTYDLPLAQVMIPGTEEGTSGLGMNAQLEVGAMVFGIFLDGKASQLPFVLGSFPRIEIADPAFSGYGTFGGAVSPSSGAPLGTSPGTYEDIDNVTPGTPNPGLTPEKSAAIRALAERYNMNPNALAGILAIESNFDTAIVGGAGGNYYGIFQLQSAQIPGLTRQVFGTAMTPSQYRTLSFTDQLKVYERYITNAGATPGFFTGEPGQDAARLWALQLAPSNALRIDYSNLDAVISNTNQADSIEASQGRVTVGSVQAETIRRGGLLD